VIEMCKPNQTEYILFFSESDSITVLNTFQLVSYSVLPPKDNRLVRW